MAREAIIFYKLCVYLIDSKGKVKVAGQAKDLLVVGKTKPEETMKAGESSGRDKILNMFMEKAKNPTFESPSVISYGTGTHDIDGIIGTCI